MMKKKVLTFVTAAMLTASVSFAAPINDLQQSETTIGYNHYKLDVSGPNIDNDSFYLEHAVSDKLLLGLERNDYSIPGYDAKATDVYAQYKINPDLRLILGNKNYSGGPDKMYYGIGGVTNLGPQLDGYASIVDSSMFTEWQVGATYKLNHQLALNLGYKSHKQDGAERAEGLGFGVNYTF